MSTLHKNRPSVRLRWLQKQRLFTIQKTVTSKVSHNFSEWCVLWCLRYASILCISVLEFTFCKARPCLPIFKFALKLVGTLHNKRFLNIQFSADSRFCISVGVRTKVSGKTVKDMGWGSKREEDGSTGESGRRVLRDDTVFANQTPPQRSMKERGRTDCRMDTDRRRMPTMVSFTYSWLVNKNAQRICLFYYI